MAEAGASEQTAANVGYYVAGSAAVAAVAAAPGYYVGTAGASTQTVAQAGYYVAISAASAQTAASPGRYVASTGATSSALAEIGYYVPLAGASAQTAASAGYFVAESGQSEQTAAPLGRYVGTTGASTTLAADAGYYVAITAATEQTAASPGYFVAEAGASEQTAASPGYYVAESGASSASEVAPGFYTSTSGATVATPVEQGFFALTAGAARPSEAGGSVAGIDVLAGVMSAFDVARIGGRRIINSRVAQVQPRSGPQPSSEMAGRTDWIVVLDHRILDTAGMADELISSTAGIGVIYGRSLGDLYLDAGLLASKTDADNDTLALGLANISASVVLSRDVGLWSGSLSLNVNQSEEDSDRQVITSAAGSVAFNQVSSDRTNRSAQLQLGISRVLGDKHAQEIGINLSEQRYKLGSYSEAGAAVGALRASAQDLSSTRGEIFYRLKLDSRVPVVVDIAYSAALASDANYGVMEQSSSLALVLPVESLRSDQYSLALESERFAVGAAMSGQGRLRYQATDNDDSEIAVSFQLWF